MDSGRVRPSCYSLAREFRRGVDAARVTLRLTRTASPDRGSPASTSRLLHRSWECDPSVRRINAAAVLATSLVMLAGTFSGAAATTAPEPTKPKRKKGSHVVDDKRCWDNFGGDPARTLSRPGLDIGLPLRHFRVVSLRSYIEYPPSYCSGILYVNTFAGRTVALDSHNGHRIWQRFGAKKPSTPAIAGGRLIVSSHDGRVTAYNRFNGQLLWRLKVNGTQFEDGDGAQRQRFGRDRRSARPCARPGPAGSARSRRR